MVYLKSSVIFAIVGLLMRYLTVSSRKQSQTNNEGFLILKMNTAYSIIGYIGIVMSGFLGIIASLGMVNNISDFFIVAALVLFFSLIGTLLVLYSRNCKVEVTKDSIRQHSISGKTKVTTWANITDIKFSKTSLELKLISAVTNIKIHMHMVGFLDFVDIMQNNLDAKLWKDAVASINKLQNKYD